MLNIVPIFVHPQLDSQVPDATFQTVLYPVPPPKSLAAENGKRSKSLAAYGHILAFQTLGGACINKRTLWLDAWLVNG